MQSTRTPEEYVIPKAAVRLMEHAEAHGWTVRSAWAADTGGSPHFTLALGRLLAGPELAMWRGDRWEYRITWHSRGLPARCMRLFGGWEITPGHPSASNLPSLTKVQEVISNHPVR